jgi:myo-inositol-1-phosphate synthase
MMNGRHHRLGRTEPQRPRSQQEVRVALAGVGNCASSLVQGVSFYANASDNESVPGLMNVRLGGYHVSDLRFVAAFDVNETKVGQDLGTAIAAPPNNTIRFAGVPHLGVPVLRGPTLDGLGRFLRERIMESRCTPVDVAEVLRRTRADVFVSYLPVGSEAATQWYAEQALAAGCAFVNCVPVFIASRPEWAQRFAQRGLPLIGDDIKSQVGATIVHRLLAHLFEQRGVRLDRTYQLNVGGNTDFENMLERERLLSKKISKTQSVLSQVGHAMAEGSVHVGPSDHVPWLEDRKIAFIRLEGTTFGGVPLSVELKLEVWDSPNSAGVVIDAVRCAKLALERGVGGALQGPSSYFMKSPPRQVTDEEARIATEAFIRGDVRPARHERRHAQAGPAST